MKRHRVGKAKSHRLHRGYVRTESGKILVQVPDGSPWGFSLLSDDQSWPGGVGIARSWKPISKKSVSAKKRAELGWILEGS
jgi:hypothetical protein